MGFAFSADGKTALVAKPPDGSVTVVGLTKIAAVRTFQAGSGIEIPTYY